MVHLVALQYEPGIHCIWSCGPIVPKCRFCPSALWTPWFLSFHNWSFRAKHVCSCKAVHCNLFISNYFCSFKCPPWELVDFGALKFPICSAMFANWCTHAPQFNPGAVHVVHRKKCGLVGRKMSAIQLIACFTTPASNQLSHFIFGPCVISTQLIGWRRTLHAATMQSIVALHSWTSGCVRSNW